MMCGVGEHVCGGAKGSECWGLEGKPEGKRPLGRPRNAWVDDTKMDIQGIGCQVGELLQLAVDRNSWRVTFGLQKEWGIS
jgi:hypothetical protein